MRGLQQANGLEELQRRLKLPRFSQGGFSEACHVFDPERLVTVMEQIGNQLDDIEPDVRLGSLAPDIVIRSGDHLFIIDAKYKGHFEELDDHRWAEISDQLSDEHRHDLHQVLAYAALYDTPNITSMLVYPMQPGTWRRLNERGLTTTVANLNHNGRNLTLALSGVPLQIPAGTHPSGLVACWNRLRDANLMTDP